MGDSRLDAPVLGFDSSTGLGSVALSVDGAVVARRFLTRQGAHAAALIPAVQEVLEEAGLAPRGLGAILVGQGPGSFTGVRVAAATAKGLAAAAGADVWPISSLLAAAASAGVAFTDQVAEWVQRLPGSRGSQAMTGEWPESGPGWDRPVAVLFDARGERLYAGVFRFRPTGWDEILPPMACTLSEFLDLPEDSLPEGTVISGDGALRHRDRIDARGFEVAAPPLGVPTAEGLLRLARLGRAALASPADPHWAPTYLRGSSAVPIDQRK
jgi:tRNA threonylcarbamoyladenosine biosynthesis protein TsaB